MALTERNIQRAVKKNTTVKLDNVQEIGAPYQLFINQKQSPWSNLTARKALRAAIDIPDIMKSIYFGTYKRAWGPLAPTTAGYDSSAVEDSFSYDPTMAKKMFASLGYAKGANGILSKGGKQLTVHYIESSPNREKRQDVAHFIAQNLKDVGIRVNTTFYTTATLQNHIERGDFDIAGLSLVNGDPNVMYSEYYSKFQNKPGRLSFNFASLRSSKMDRLLLKGQTSTDKAVRRKAYSQAQKYVVDNAISIGVYVPAYTVVYQKKVNGLRYDDKGYPVFYDTYLSSS